MMYCLQDLIEKSQLFSKEGKVRLIKSIEFLSQSDQESIKNILREEQTLHNKNDALFLSLLAKNLKKQRFEYLKKIDKKELEDIESLINHS